VLNRRTWAVQRHLQNVIVRQVSPWSFSRLHRCRLVPLLSKLASERHLLEAMFHQPIALTTPCLEQRSASFCLSIALSRANFYRNKICLFPSAAAFSVKYYCLFCLSQHMCINLTFTWYCMKSISFWVQMYVILLCCWHYQWCAFQQQMVFWLFLHYTDN